MHDSSISEFKQLIKAMHADAKKREFQAKKLAKAQQRFSTVDLGTNKKGAAC